MAETIREGILEYLLSLFSGYSENGLQVFNFVRRVDLREVDMLELPAIGVEEGQEDVLDRTNYTIDKLLRVYIHFKWTNEEGVDPFSKFNYYLGIVQSIVLSDLTLGGRVIDTQEAGSNPEISRHSPHQSGSLYLDILYRHRNGNPYTGA